MLDEIKKLLGDHKISGKHLIFKVCPFCGRDKGKFYLNYENMMFDCKSASCGESGHIRKLARHIGAELKIPKINAKSESVVQDLKVNIRDFKPISENSAIIDYMSARGISKNTLETYKVIFDPRSRAMAFATVDAVKKKYLALSFRTLDKKIWKQPGSRQFLWNRHNLDAKEKVIYITEGEIDALTLLEMGYPNVVSMPQGANSHEWIHNEYDSLKEFKEIYLLYDNDDAGRVGLDAAAKRLDFASIKTIDYKEFNDINEFYLEDPTGLRKALEESIDIMHEGIIDITDVKLAKNELFSSGDKQLDYIMAGLRMNEITILSAIPGAGKSTFISNWVANLMELGERAFVYSGELSDSTTKNWIYSVIAGPDHLEHTQHPFRRNDNISLVKPETEKKIDKWVKNRLFLHKGELAHGDKLINEMKLHAKKLGVRWFFIDNLSVIEMTGDRLGEQSKFSKELMSFVKEHEVHVVLVAHPRKQPRDEGIYDIKGNVKTPPRMSKYDVSGSSDLVNLAHNVLLMTKANEHIRLWMESKYTGESFSNLDMLMFLDKNREGGFVNEDILYTFDRDSKRFKSFYDPLKKNKTYSYDTIEVDTLDDIVKIAEELFC